MLANKIVLNANGQVDADGGAMADNALVKSTITAAWKRRQAYFRSGDITWSEDRTNTNTFFDKEEDGKLQWLIHDGVVHIDHERFAFEGEKKMYYDRAWAGSGCNGPAQPWERYTSGFNGALQFMYTPPSPKNNRATCNISVPTRETWDDARTLSFLPIILGCRPVIRGESDLESDDYRKLVATDDVVHLDSHHCAGVTQKVGRGFLGRRLAGSTVPATG